MIRWRKLFGSIVEASAAKSSPRFNAYHTARIEYEKYLMEHGELLIENGGPTTAGRKAANNSPELAKVEELFIESIQGATEKQDYADAATAYQQLGQLYFYQGRLEESKTNLKKALELYSGLVSLDKGHKAVQSDTHYFLGLTLIDMKDFTNAKKELDISTAIDKANNNTYNLQYGELAMQRLEERKNQK